MECDKDCWCAICQACFEHCGCLEREKPDPNRPCRPGLSTEEVVAAIAAAILTSEDPEDTEGQP
jgi:hypothetical protein